jgi:cytochrome c553
VTVPGTAKVGGCSIRVRALLPAGILLLVAACAEPETRSTAAFSADGQVIAMSGGDGGPSNACFSCHGLDGMGDGVSTPRLAGLDAGYLQKQLEDYAARLRDDPRMYEAARWLDDDDRRAVAAWYADLPTPPRSGSAGPAPAVWFEPRPEAGGVACAACHGERGQGVGAGNPAVAGQPAAYVVDQLQRWQAGKRRNDPRGVMSGAVAGLTDSEIRAIAAWLERAPTAPAPASAAATASASAAAAARPAASRGPHRPDR